MSTATIDDTDEITTRLDEMTSAIDEIASVRDETAAVARRLRSITRLASLRSRLATEHGPDIARSMMQRRRDCIHYVTKAMACAESIELIDGALAIKCTSAGELLARRCPFCARSVEPNSYLDFSAALRILWRRVVLGKRPASLS